MNMTCLLASELKLEIRLEEGEVQLRRTSAIHMKISVKAS